jgi:hypothetical protein
MRTPNDRLEASAAGPDQFHPALKRPARQPVHLKCRGLAELQLEAMLRRHDEFRVDVVDLTEHKQRVRRRRGRRHNLPRLHVALRDRPGKRRGDRRVAQLHLGRGERGLRLGELCPRRLDVFVSCADPDERGILHHRIVDRLRLRGLLLRHVQLGHRLVEVLLGDRALRRKRTIAVDRRLCHAHRRLRGGERGLRLLYGIGRLPALFRTGPGHHFLQLRPRRGHGRPSLCFLGEQIACVEAHERRPGAHMVAFLNEDFGDAAG